MVQKDSSSLGVTWGDVGGQILTEARKEFEPIYAAARRCGRGTEAEFSLETSSNSVLQVSDDGV